MYKRGGGGGSPPFACRGRFSILMRFIDLRILDSDDIHRPHPGPRENMLIGGERCAISQIWPKWGMLGKNPPLTSDCWACGGHESVLPEGSLHACGPHQVWPLRSECCGRGVPTKVVCAEYMKMCCLRGKNSVIRFGSG